MPNWIISVIHIAAWLIPFIYIFRTSKAIGIYSILLFGGWGGSSIMAGGYFYPILWLIYAIGGALFAYRLKGWWRWTGLVLIPIVSWLMINYVLGGTIFWF